MSKMNVLNIVSTELQKIQFLKNAPQDDKLNKQRRRKLEKSAQLGIRDFKTKIAFESVKRGILQIESAVIAVTKDYVVLKGGSTIPISAIREVRLL